MKFKLKTYKEIKNITTLGQKHVTPNFMCFCIKAEGFKFGVLISKKFGKAVKRNFAKRRLQVCVNNFCKKHGLINVHFVFIPRYKISTANFAILEEELEQILLNF